MKYRNLPFTTYILSRRALYFWGKINYVFAFWWGVKIGKGVRFDGKCNFHRFPKTIIKIGNHCEFLSRNNSNLIGIDRPCSISTHLSSHNAILEIGEHCGFSGTVIGCFKHIRIGAHVRCGANTLITDSDWHGDDPRVGEDADVVIEDNVWLGEGVKVLKGVTIGKNAVIGAGSIVTKDIPPNVIAAGNPCKVIKSIS